MNLPSQSQRIHTFNGTFQDCKGLTGSIPAELFSGIEGSINNADFYSIFQNCSGRTGYVDGGLFTVPAGDATNPYSGTFNGANKLDKVRPNNTYTAEKPLSTWNVAVCNPCPDTSPMSDSVVESINMCYMSATCDAGMYYNATASECVACPANSYCTGGI